MPHIAPGLALAVVGLLLRTASADDAAARQASREADALAGRGDLVAAAAKFRAAFALDPQPAYLCNSGVAYFKAQDWSRAILYLQKCVEIGASLDAAFLANVRKVIASVSAKLAGGAFTPVDFVIQPSVATITVEGGVPFDEPLVGSMRAWFPRGTYRVTIAAPGYLAQTQAIEATSSTALSIRAALAREVPAAPKPTTVRDPASEPTTATGPAPSRAAASPSRVLPIVVTVGAGLTGLVAGGALAYTLGKRDDAVAASDRGDMPAFAAHVDDFHTGRRVYWIAGGVTGVAAVAAGYLWYRALRPPRVELGATETSATISLRGEF